MDIVHNEYVEIEYANGLGIKPQAKLYTEQLPEVIVSNIPVELQEFHYASGGKGRRIAYSYRPTGSLDFVNSQFPAPLSSKLHKHDCFELVFVASGKLGMQIESQLCEFNSWDVCILNRSTRHAERFQPDGKLYYLVLSPEYLLQWPWEEGMSLQHSVVFANLFNKGLRDSFQQNKDYVAARYTGQAVIPPLHGIIQDIRREFEQKQPGYQLFVRGLLYRLFTLLADPQCYTTEYIDLGADDGFSLAHSAKQMLDKNKRKMSKQEVADKLNYSSEHINRLFKKHYGKSIPEYNRDVYMRQAALLLGQTGQHIHSICKQLGFTNRTHFYQLFKQEYGCTPAEYRRKDSGFMQT